MLSSRCKTIVKQELLRLNVESQCSELGTVNIAGSLSISKWEVLKDRLKMVGLELMGDKKTLLSNQIKSLVHEALNSEEDYLETNATDFLRQHMNMDYPYLAKAFGERNKLTLKQFIITERVKKVKELIQNHQHNLADISSKLHYSSTAHLCHEFKKVTGLTPKFFKQFV
ncbi:helix-turn-helix domain-containing protein [Aquirufa ecclesiirivi]|uniref:helix-turn-helix domain-containing protein n=1 Tax=Aquirufa ecclesiirivi TaxID=2715124 RepID=UPI003BB1C229